MAEAPSTPTSADDGGGEHASHEFPVVAIGASAGGLDALNRLFASTPRDPGMAFVVVTHISAGRPSLLPQLLSLRTELPVIAVDGPTALEVDRIYVAPPGRYLEVEGSSLVVRDIGGTPRPLPIDHLFSSLAAARGRYGFGVVLSGTGSDGTLGIRQLKAAGGLTVAQEEASAMYPGMPHSAAATDMIDYVLPPEEIPARLVAYARSAFAQTPPPPAPHEETLRRIFTALRRATGHDFASYKLSTIQRRIDRRMHVLNLGDASAYADYLEANRAETGALFHELLIGVTSFFRDPEAFDALVPALEALVSSRSGEGTLRIWVAGCSTGEEAYTIAMIVREVLDRLHTHLRVQIFATDLDGTAIDEARVGRYPSAAAEQISRERVERFLVPDESGYRIRKDLREMIVFAQHNLISDPPFTRIDLISCRNLLIYLNADLQARLMSLFHYALRPNGVLFLGSSETAGASTQAFDIVDKKWRIFRRSEIGEKSLDTDLLSVPETERPRLARPLPRTPSAAMTQAARQVLLDQRVPPSVLVHESGEIVHIHGRTGEFLELPAGPLLSLNVVAMARDGLGIEISHALREAARSQRQVIERDLQLPIGGQTLRLLLRVSAVREPEAFRGTYVVTFDRQAAREPVAADASRDGAPRVVELERELQHAREVHQGVVEELETSNEELKSTNEELQSANEELQSTNEELETSKEEMQSLNEELQTVNAELQQSLDALSRTNDDMKNLLNSTEIATLFLDSDLRIKRFTEQARKVLPLTPPDVGRPVGDLVSFLRYDDLTNDAQEVLRTLVFVEKEVPSQDGHWYLIRIHPYRTTMNVIDGLVITFVDITRVKGLQERNGAIDQALRGSPTVAFGLDAALRVVWSCGLLFGVEPEQVIDRGVAEPFPPAVAAPLDAVVRRAAAGRAALRERMTITSDARVESYDVYLDPHRGSDAALLGLTGVITHLGA